LEAAEQLQDLIPNSVKVRPKLDQNLSSDSFAFPNQAKQDVFGADVGMIDLQRFTQAEFENLFCSRGEWDVSARRLLAMSDDLFYLLPDGL
jgi:hypothetical protein